VCLCIPLSLLGNNSENMFQPKRRILGDVFYAVRVVSKESMRFVLPRSDLQGPTIVGTGNGTPEVPELPNAWGYSWATLSPGVINTER
jgi:hypothetical protein